MDRTNDIRSMGTEEVLSDPEVEITFVQDDLFDGVVPAIDIDIGKAGVHLSTDGEVISERDENGKPITGRYPWSPVSERITDMILDGADKEEIEKAVNESMIFLDGLKNNNPVYHPEAYERQAQMVAVSMTTKWIREHPGYSMEELTKVKAGFLEEARNEIRKAISELEADYQSTVRTRTEHD